LTASENRGGTLLFPSDFLNPTPIWVGIDQVRASPG
jgi:hypothetical protein